MKLCPVCKNTYPDDYQVCPRDQTVLAMVGTEIVPGTILRGKYEVLSELGAGGMATVYKVRHRAFQELAAVKVVHAHFMHDAGFNKRFRNEAVVARQLKHPNAVRIDDFDHTEDGRPFIVMEFVDGLSLLEARKGTPGAWPVERCVRIVLQAAEALGAAHKLGIVHRDIKPSNIVLMRGANDTLQVKVLDFGIAKVSGVEAFAGMTTVATMQGHVIGTPEYMSPEQASGGSESGIDGRSDLYSLGLVLYEMLTGAHPFQADTPMGVLNQQLYKVPAPPESVVAVPTALSALVLKMLQKDPKERFQNAEEVVAALRDPQEWDGPTPATTKIEFSDPVVRPFAPTVSELRPVEPVKPLLDESSSPAVRSGGAGWRKLALPLLATLAMLVLIGWFVIHRRTLGRGGTPATGKPVATQEDAPTFRLKAQKLLDAKRYAEVLSLAKAACDQGNAAGCSILGRMYNNGEGVETNMPLGLELSRKGCDGGDARGCTNLGMEYHLGLAVAPDDAQAVPYFRKGCDGGDAKGCAELGYLYENGSKEGIAKDVPKAAELYSKACDGGYADSCTRVAYLYSDGDTGFAKNAAQAVAFYRKGCDGGDALGCTNLGVLYENGTAGTKHIPEAIVLYRRGCAGGNKLACTYLKGFKR